LPSIVVSELLSIRSFAEAVAIWPAAGLALGVFLMKGPHLWVGVGLSGVLTGLWWDSSFDGLAMGLLLGALTVFQSVLGYYGTRPLLESPIPLASSGQAARFLLLSGPVACGLATGLGVLFLAGATEATRADLLTYGSQWWSSTTLGAMVFAPMLILLWPKQPHPHLSHRTYPAIALLTTALILGTGTAVMSLWAEDREADEQARRTRIVEAALVPGSELIEPLHDIRRLLAARGTMSREAFETFTRGIGLGQEFAFQSVDWAPRVVPTDSARPPADGLFQLDPTGERVPRDTGRAIHFPVRYTSSSQAFRGLDHGFDPRRRAAMAQARDTGEPVATRINPVMHTERGGILVFMPIYRDRLDVNETSSVGERRANLAGYLVGRSTVTRLFRPVLQATKPLDLTYRIMNLTPDEPAEVVAGTLAADREPTLQQKITFGQQVWRLDLAPRSPRPVPIAQGLILYHTLASLAGFFIVLFMLVATGRHEITRKEVERRTRELERAQREAEQANRAKSAFLASMSHEIRTPLNAVLGMAELLTQRSLDPQSTELAQTISRSGRLLMQIVDDILDFSKIEAGRLELSHNAVDIEELVEGLCHSMASTAKERDVDLQCFISPQLPQCVQTDEVRLRQILYNLIGNAIKFSPAPGNPRGHVSIRAELLPQDPSYAQLTVRDNGIGMEPATIHRVFSAFTQGDADTTRRYGGTGLGLAICSRLVGAMGGEIQVTSTPGHGSTFTVTLPCTESGEQAREPDPALTELTCILIGFSSEETQDLRTYLEASGANVVPVSDIPDAVEVAAQSRYPVAIHAPGHLASGIEDRIGAFESVENTCHVCLSRGDDNGYRIEAPGVVTLAEGIRRRRPLLSAIALAAARTAPENGSSADRTAPTRRQPAGARGPTDARGLGQLILVAEDDAVNRQVIQHQLGHLGYVAEMAEDGTTALQRWRTGAYGLLLTDLHMPEMDGYALARAIRREETGTARFPIVALTANALRGQAKRAQAVGMDDYLTKPVELDALAGVLARWIPPVEDRAKETADPRMAESTTTAPVLDTAYLEQVFSDHQPVIREVLDEYRQALRDGIPALEQAIRNQDAEQIEAVAHRLKGSSRSVGARELADHLEAIQKAGEQADPRTAQRQFDALRAPLSNLQERLGERLSEAETVGEAKSS
jgi:signal transduction histidine kinase/CheY-like chemotaxis protein